MTCDQISEDLSAYLDGELPADARSAVESHIASCAECRTQLEELKSLTGSLQDLPRYTAPATLVAEVHERVQKSPAPLILIGGGSPIVNASGDTMQPRSMWGPVAFGIAAVLMLFALAFAVMPALSNSANPTAMREQERRRIAADANKDKAAATADADALEEKSEHKVAMKTVEAPRQEPAAPVLAAPAADAKLKELRALERDRASTVEKQQMESLDKAADGESHARRGAAPAPGGGKGAGDGGGIAPEAAEKPMERMRKAALSDAEFKKADALKPNAALEAARETNALQLQQKKQEDGKPATNAAAVNGVEVAKKRVDAVDEARNEKTELLERSGGNRRLKGDDAKNAETSGAPKPFAQPPAPVVPPRPEASAPAATPAPGAVPAQPKGRAPNQGGRIAGEAEIGEDAFGNRNVKADAGKFAATDKAGQEPRIKDDRIPQSAKELAKREAGAFAEKDLRAAEKASTAGGNREREQEGKASRSIGAPTAAAPATTAPAPADDEAAGGGDKPGAATARAPQSSSAARKDETADAKEVAKSKAEDAPVAKRMAVVEEQKNFGAAKQQARQAIAFKTREPKVTFAEIEQLAKQNGGTVELKGNDINAHIPAATREAFIRMLAEMQAPKPTANTVKKMRPGEAGDDDAPLNEEVTLMVVVLPDSKTVPTAAPAEKAPGE